MQRSHIITKHSKANLSENTEKAQRDSQKGTTMMKSHAPLPKIVQGIHVAGGDNTVLKRRMRGSIKGGDYTGEGEVSVWAERAPHMLWCPTLLQNTQSFPLFTSSKKKKVFKKFTTPAKPVTQGVRGKERAREVRSVATAYVRECKRGRAGEEHVTSADQSPPSASRIGLPPFELQGILSTGWKLHVSPYSKQECFFTTAFP